MRGYENNKQDYINTEFDEVCFFKLGKSSQHTLQARIHLFTVGNSSPVISG